MESPKSVFTYDDIQTDLSISRIAQQYKTQFKQKTNDPHLIEHVY